MHIYGAELTDTMHTMGIRSCTCDSIFDHRLLRKPQNNNTVVMITTVSS